MKYFCMPADFKKETIDKYEEINQTYRDARVVETYGNITVGDNFGSGRVLKQLPKVDFLGLKEYVEYSLEKNIDFNYTLNVPYIGNQEFTQEGVFRIKRFLKNLYEVGIRTITVSLPSLVDIIKYSGCDFKLTASTICHINNANRALAYKKAGFERIVVDESIHRDFETLKSICGIFGDQVEMIVNTMCHRNCQYRNFHYNETGGDSAGIPNDVGINFFEHKCLLQRYDTIGGLLKLGWVRPEDLHYYYDTGIRYFKLQGRQHVHKGGHLRTLEHYLKESYDGGLMDLLDMFNPRYSFSVYLDNKKLDGFLEPYYKKGNFCKFNCSQCSYCDNFSKKCIDHEKAREIISLAREFYNESDQLKHIVESTEVEETTDSQSQPMKVDFDFA
ncbi:MAG: hypothetical protein GTO45_32420 [Candidatus Aminicenantes bacterium]|nr:hypothetical protein [Candidatus Aminicenantes bacterium]NIM83456.1 hypothetical protein [Candidatus Aminicenantes bacterium]NIN22848.1 hypothetical protein [Candidatus Aminicenantes bacterium]NIN46584.1 hypothetical protein [Candidatus Aminicenantes bacterium]NIN89487.1 hypothetical protein [Candidatus Aminicenantes bacterium]